MSVWILTPRRILWDVVCIAEVIVSVVVHLSYGLSVFGSAVWIDVMSTLSASRPQSRPHAHARVHPIVDENGENSKFVADDDDDDDDERATTRAVKQQHVEGFGAHVLEGHHEKPPIVLLHGIFGFGKEVGITLLYSKAPCVIRGNGICQAAYTWDFFQGSTLLFEFLLLYFRPSS